MGLAPMGTQSKIRLVRGVIVVLLLGVPAVVASGRIP